MLESMTRRLHIRLWPGLLALTVAAQAGAACMSAKSPLSPLSTAPRSADLMPALYRPGESFGPGLLTVGDFQRDDAIVGLWQFRMTGFSVDWGTQAWHADGTEIMFSGGQNPETGDVCQGVWRKVGPSTYTLNHIAMGWLAPGAGFGLRIHIHMTVGLDKSGNAFRGTYHAAAYQVSPEDPFDESVKVGSGSGTVTATRVRPD